MHAFIVTGGSQSWRSEYIEKELASLKVSPFDVTKIIPETVHIGIGDIRQFQKNLYIKPLYSDYRIGIIEHADTLTTDAQNALLKLLEEPPPTVQIFLLTAMASSLLPTVISRCQLITLPSTDQFTKDESTETLNVLEHLVHSSIGARMQKIDEIASTRESANEFLEHAIGALEQLLHANKHPEGSISRELGAKLLRTMTNARNKLHSNVSPKLVLDSCFWIIA